MAYVEVPHRPYIHSTVDNDSAGDSDFDGDELFRVGQYRDDHESVENEDGGEDEDEALTFRTPFTITRNLFLILLVHCVAPSESDGSGSNYSETVREKRQRARRMRKDDTSDSDITSDEDSRSPGNRKRQSTVPTRSPDHHSRVDKGKGRAHSPAFNMEPSRSAPTEAHKKRGPFSNAAKQEIASFADDVMDDADRLAAKFGKTRHDVLVQAGLGSVKSTRALNASNVFRKWYSAHYPKADGSKSDTKLGGFVS